MARDDGTDVTRLVSEHAASLAYDVLPRELVELIKQIVLDTLGVAIGASGLAPEARVVAEYVEALGGRPESTVLGFGFKAPAPWAAFVNGSLGHMLDYDDVGAGGHVGIATVPVAFAVAEKLGHVSGRDLIAAIAAGTDLHTRLDLAVRLPDWTMTEGWFATQLFGFLSGVITAGRLRGFDPEQIENSLGIAFTQVSGSRQMAVGASTDLRSMQAGFSGQGAVLATELAARGIVGSKEIIEGRYGIYKTYVRNEPAWSALTAGLGTSFPLLDEHGFKVWPACGYTRATNTATLRLREENRLKPEDVATITVIGGTGATRLLSEPLELKRRPQLSIDGKYSIPRAYQLHLIAQQRSWAHINQAVSALRFFYSVTLGRTDALERIVAAREPQKFPVVLSADEIVRFLEAVPGLRNRAALTMAYGSGLRGRE